MASSVRRPGVAWMIRDSGNPASLYALRLRDGKPWVREIKVKDARNQDWEDITYTVGPDGKARPPHRREHPVRPGALHLRGVRARPRRAGRGPVQPPLPLPLPRQDAEHRGVVHVRRRPRPGDQDRAGQALPLPPAPPRDGQPGQVRRPAPRQRPLLHRPPLQRPVPPRRLRTTRRSPPTAATAARSVPSPPSSPPIARRWPTATTSKRATSTPTPPATCS